MSEVLKERKYEHGDNWQLRSTTTTSLPESCLSIVQISVRLYEILWRSLGFWSHQTHFLFQIQWSLVSSTLIYYYFCLFFGLYEFPMHYNLLFLFGVGCIIMVLEYTCLRIQTMMHLMILLWMNHDPLIPRTTTYHSR